MARTVLRYYQEEAVKSVMDFWAEGGGNPLVTMATGTGKSPTMAAVARGLMREFPDFRILMLVHVKELVEQNAMALLREWPSAPLGINSAGIGRRDTWHPILYGSIQSLWRKPELLGDRDLVMIDECHLVPKTGLGMYRKLLDSLLAARPDMRILGFTATPFRLDSGRLDRGPDKLFDKEVYNYGIAQGIKDGYLSPLVPFRMDNEISTSGLSRRGGDFTDASVAAAADNDEVIKAAVKELAQHGEHRRAWLSFGCGIEHAEKLAEASRAIGIQSVAITSHTSDSDRAAIIRDYKAGNGHVRHLTNAMVLTTGFDAPITDLVSLFRPTLSTVLYVQTLGRGTRLMGLNIAESIANGKPDCLVLDFAGNVRRHGPVDAVMIQDGSGRGLTDPDDIPQIRADEVRARACPQCGFLNAMESINCTNCQHLLVEPPKPKHQAEAEAGLAILSADKDPWEPISETRFHRHEKAGSFPSMKVEYQDGNSFNRTYREWIAFEHKGFAREKAVMWWNRLGGSLPVPRNADEALGRTGELRVITAVKVEQEGQYKSVVARKVHRTARYADGAEAVSSVPPGFAAWR